MIKIGITGQSGFIGTHLFNTFRLQPENFECIPFERGFFSDGNKLKKFVQDCDVIIHLAAMNRHNNPDIIYQTNIQLVKKLIEACESTQSTPHILFSSSTQEEQDNLYGKSKKDGRKLLQDWADNNHAKFTGLIIPNVYGPFGNPYYNSVIATFCHQLTHNEFPAINVDSELKLIYIAELVKCIFDRIMYVNSNCKNDVIIEVLEIEHTAQAKVSTILDILEVYKTNYFEKGEIPGLDNSFRGNLFKTFLPYVDHETFFPFILKKNSDYRGDFVETMALNSGGQVSFSTTLPGITRGNHFHTRKTERFAIIKGKARIDIRRIGTDKIISFDLDGKEPAFVDMPVWYTHNITNIGDEDLYTIFWINEFFDVNDSDTFFEPV